MSNPIFQALGGQGQNPMLQNFQRFMQQMQGKDPNALIQEMMQSGKISQEQYNQARQQAQQIANTFQSMPGFSNKL